MGRVYWVRRILEDRYEHLTLSRLLARNPGMQLAVGVFAITVAFLTAVACLPPANAADSPSGRPAAKFEAKGPEKKDGIETYVITSDYQEKPCEVQVLLPGNFTREGRYKVLYVMPVNAGMGGRWGSAIGEAKKLDLANKYGIICVEPTFSRWPWYGDHPTDTKIRYGSYLPEVIVPFMDKTFPTLAKPEGRALVGFSKSGTGAIGLLLRDPDIFGRAGSWDAPLMMTTVGDFETTEIYGTQENFTKYSIPELLTKNATLLQGQPARIAIMGHSMFRPHTERGHKLADDLRIPHYFDNSVNRPHNWGSGWLAPLVEVLMAEDMAKARPALTPPTEEAGRRSDR